MANEEDFPEDFADRNGQLGGQMDDMRDMYDDRQGERIQQLEETHASLKEDNDSELNKLRAWYSELEYKFKEEKERADREAANIAMVQQEKQHLQQQINELQSAAGNMASTAESVHKWLEDRTRTARRECREEKTRADQAASSVEALTVEKQELVQQLNELHAAADNMVTTAAESVHQLVEERTRETLLEAQTEKNRADEEAQKVQALEEEREAMMEKMAEFQRLQLQKAAEVVLQQQPQQPQPKQRPQPKQQLQPQPQQQLQQQQQQQQQQQLQQQQQQQQLQQQQQQEQQMLMQQEQQMLMQQEQQLLEQQEEQQMLMQQEKQLLEQQEQQLLQQMQQQQQAPEGGVLREASQPQEQFFDEETEGLPVYLPAEAPEGMQSLGGMQTLGETNSTVTLPLMSASQAEPLGEMPRQPENVVPAAAAGQQPVWVGTSSPRVNTSKLGQPTVILTGSQVAMPPNVQQGITQGLQMNQPLATNRIVTSEGISLVTPTMTRRDDNLQSPRPLSEARVVRMPSPHGPEVGAPFDPRGSDLRPGPRRSPLSRYVSTASPAPAQPRSSMSAYRLISPQRALSEPASKVNARMRSVERQTSAARREFSGVSRERSPRMDRTPFEAGVRVATLESLESAAAKVNTGLGTQQFVQTCAAAATGSTSSLPLNTPSSTSNLSRTTGAPGSVPRSLAQYQFIRSSLPVPGQGPVVRSLSHSGVSNGGSRGGSLIVGHGGSRGGSVHISPADSRSSSVQRSASNPASLYSPTSSRNSSLVPLPNRKRSEPAARAALPRLTSGVPWQQSEDDGGVVIATLDNAAGRKVVDTLSASVQSHLTDTSGITCIDFSNMSDGGQFGDYSITEPPSQRISLKSQQVDGGYVLTRSGIGASQPVMAQMLQMGSQPVMTRYVDNKMPSTPRMSSTPRIAGTSGASPLLSARGRQQSTSAIAISGTVPMWQGDGFSTGGGVPSPKPPGPMTVEPNFMNTKMNGKLSGSLTLPMARGGTAATVRGGSLQTPVRYDKTVGDSKSGSTLPSRLLSTPRVAQRQMTPRPSSPRPVAARASSPPPLRASNVTRPSSPPPPPLVRRNQSPHVTTRTRRAEPSRGQLAPEMEYKALWVPDSPSRRTNEQSAIRLPAEGIRAPPEQGRIPAWMVPGASLKPMLRPEMAVAKVTEPVVTTPVRGGTPARMLPHRNGPTPARSSAYPVLGGVNVKPQAVGTAMLLAPFTPR